MAEDKEPKTRRTIRAADFTKESFQNLASHSSSYGVEGLLDKAALAAASKDQTKVTIVEDRKKPKRGDVVIFPAGHSVKIHSVYDGMIWPMNSDGSDTEGDRPIPIKDVQPSAEQGTWLYTGDTRAE
ncbi:MAG: hypothetical protein WBQ08_18535 [Candidatus Sulfotelmatobacter sp.]|jgi:hypothetical protein